MSIEKWLGADASPSEWVKDQIRGVSPVVGVILMVAITVVLAGILGVFVLNMGGQEVATPQHLNVQSTGEQQVSIQNMGNDVDGAATDLVVQTSGGQQARITPGGETTGDLDVSVWGGPYGEFTNWETGQSIHVLITDPYESAEVMLIDTNAETMVYKNDVEPVSHSNPRKSCLALKQSGTADTSGEYDLDTDGDGTNELTAHCDMDTDAGGWTLVASAANEDAEGSPGYWAQDMKWTSSYGYAFEDDNYDSGDPNGTDATPEQLSDNINWDKRVAMWDLYTTTDTVNSDPYSEDTIQPAYHNVSFNEQMFVNAEDDFVKYSIRGNNVRDWFEANAKNGFDHEARTTECTLKYNTSWDLDTNACHHLANDKFDPTQTNLDEEVNGWGDLSIQFHAEDGDSAIGATFNAFYYGPTWNGERNSGGVEWDDAGYGWHHQQLGGQNADESDYLVWAVR